MKLHRPQLPLSPGSIDGGHAVGRSVQVPGWIRRGGSRPGGGTTSVPPHRLESGVVDNPRARLRTCNDLYRSMVSGRRTQQQPAFRDARRGRRGVLGALRDELSWLLAFPDQGRGWFWKGVLETLRIAREHEAEVLISSGPPHGHLVGAVAALRTGLPHVVDLRDPWATHRYDMRIWRSNLVQGVGRFALPTLERFAFRRADLVVANTRRLRDLPWSSALPVRAGRVGAERRGSGGSRETRPGA